MEPSNVTPDSLRLTRRFHEGRRELVQSELLRNPRLHLHFDFLKTENSALLGYLDTFVNGSHKFIDFLGFLKPSPQLSPFFWPELFNCLLDFSSRD